MDGVFQLVAGQFDPGVSAETRSLENPAISLNDPRAWEDAGLLGGTSDAGETISVDSFLSVPAVWQAVGMISGDCSKLPLEIFQRDGDDRTPAYDHPAYSIVYPYSRANPQTSGLQFWRRLYAHALIWARGFGWIERDGAGRPRGLYNLLPDRTSVEEIRGRLWVLSDVGDRLEAFDPDDVLILENLALDAVSAFGPLRAARHNVGLALAARGFTSRFYRNGCHAGGVLQVPPGASDKAVTKMQESIEKKRSGDNQFKSLVMRDGFKFEQTMVSPDDAQANETEERLVRDVARFYRLAPSRLGAKESISYNSEEAARRAYHDETLSYWLSAVRAEATIKLLTEEERKSRRYFAEHNVQALHWADLATISAVVTSWSERGLMLPDEGRHLINLSSLPNGEGKVRLVPKNMDVAGGESPPDDEPEQPAIDAQQGEETLAAARDLAAATITRMVGRLNVQAQRAIGGKRLATWLDGAAAEHRDTLVEMWAPVARLGAALGLGDSTGLVDELLTAYVGDLRIHQASALAECERWHTDAGMIFANRFCKPKENKGERKH